MFRLLRWLVSLMFSFVMLLVVIWFATTVPLGKRTLWGHLRAIFGTQEAKDLAAGTKEEAEKVAKKVKEELHTPDLSTGTPAKRVHAPLDPIDERDRHKLDRLVKEKTQ
jgi:hypothetical protein